MLGLEGRAVDALEHGAVLVAAPVGPGHVEQLEGGYPAGGFDVRAGAEVFELAVGVGGDGFAVGYLGDDLQFERLVGVELVYLVAGVLAVLELVIALDDAAHTVLDSADVVGREGFFNHEVVVEAVLCGRADAYLGVGKEGLHDVGHDVGGGVSDASPQFYEFGVGLQRHL